MEFIGIFMTVLYTVSIIGLAYVVFEWYNIFYLFYTRTQNFDEALDRTLKLMMIKINNIIETIK